MSAETGEAGCQTAGGPPTIEGAPWRGYPLAEDYDRLAAAAAERPDGRPLSVLVEAVYGDAFASAGAEYQRARRFYRNRPDWFLTTRRDGLLWVYPTPRLCRAASLDTASKHTVESPEGAGTAMSNARSLLARRLELSGASERGDLLGAFGAKREAEEGRYVAYQDTYSPEEHALVPLSTRFNSERRVRERREAYNTAWTRARERYDVGVLATLTMDPARFSDLLEPCEEWRGAVNRLKDWAAYSPESGPPRMGERRPSLVVPEFTEKGRLHVHVVFFGVGWVAEHGALSRYWAESRDFGEVVHLDRLETRGGRWRWAKAAEPERHGADRRTPPREYLAAGLDLLERSAKLDAGQVQAAAQALRRAGRDDGEEADPEALERGERLWKAALYWAGEVPVYTLSPELRPDDGDSNARAPAPDGTPLPEDAGARFRPVGVARYDEFPGYVRDGAVVVRRDAPPPGDGEGGGRGVPPPGGDL